MTWCLITSQKARGGRGLGSSSCSPSSRRQCCPADRKCTDEPDSGCRHGSGECSRDEGEAERTMGIVFVWDQNEAAAKAAREDDGQMNRTALPAGRADESTQASFVCLCLSV